jgi:hypothetical protein
VSSLIKGARKRVCDLKGHPNPEKVDEEGLHGQLELLTNMRVFEHEIIDDEEHLGKCCSP